jgi:hypothetical protein
MVLSLPFHGDVIVREKGAEFIRALLNLFSSDIASLPAGEGWQPDSLGLPR